MSRRESPRFLRSGRLKQRGHVFERRTANLDSRARTIPGGELQMQRTLARLARRELPFEQGREAAIMGSDDELAPAAQCSRDIAQTQHVDDVHSLQRVVEDREREPALLRLQVE